MGTNLRALAIAVALAVVGIAPMTTSAQAQDATPAPRAADQTTVEIPETRIVALSPDGTLFAAGNVTDSRPSQLCVYDVATLTEEACGDLESRQISIWLDSLVWSPDSTKIAFGEDAFRTFNDGDLWVMDAATGEITNLTDDGFEGGMPMFPEDEGQPKTPITVDVLPAWAPDSQSIAFSRSPVIDGEFQGNEIASVELASGEVETFVEVTPEEPGVVYFGLAWAPDGGRLYYSITYPQSDNPENGVWVYDRATSQSQHILKNDPEKGPPALMRVAASGRTGLVFYPIFFGQYDAQGDVYALLDLETHAVSPVNPVVDPSVHAFVRVATFSPDGTRVLYGLFQLEGSAGRFLVRPLPDGEPELVAEIDGPPVMTTIGGGLFWANDGTVFAATDVNAGMKFHLDPGEAPSGPELEPVGSPEASPVASPVTGGFETGATVTLAAEAPLRATPSGNGAVVLELRPGAELMVVGEPVEAGGALWVPVVEPATGTIGYVDASLFQPVVEEPA